MAVNVAHLSSFKTRARLAVGVSKARASTGSNDMIAIQVHVGASARDRQHLLLATNHMSRAPSLTSKLDILSAMVVL